MTSKLNTPIELPGGGGAAAVWLQLHSTGRLWPGTYVSMASGSIDERRLFGEALSHLRGIAGGLRKFPADRWRMICEGEGWTPIGCCAWSWCEGVELSAVIDMARQLDWTPLPTPAAEFAAMLIDPEKLPPNKLSKIFRAGRDEFGSGLIVAARNEPPEVDLPPDKLPLVPSLVNEMLELRRGR